MILVDSSVWIDHFRHANAALSALLESSVVMAHPAVIGELALGSLRHRSETIEAMRALPRAPVASDIEAMHLIETRRLHGRGIGWIDAHLLASVLLAGDGKLWTRDKRLHAIASELGIEQPG